MLAPRSLSASAAERHVGLDCRGCTPARVQRPRRSRERPATIVARSGGNAELHESRRELLLSASLAAATFLPLGSQAGERDSIYELSALYDDEAYSFSQFKDKNINYPGLRALYDKYSSQGFNLVAFPCNQFGGQAPGSSQEERDFAHKKFGFDFPVMDKIDVNGDKSHPIYKLMKQQQPKDLPNGISVGLEKGRIAWNYTKFLVDRQGRAAARFGPSFDPLKFELFVQRLLAGDPAPPVECLKHPDRNVCKT